MPFEHLDDNLLFIMPILGWEEYKFIVLQYLVNSPFFYREMGDFQTICKIQHINFVEVNLP